MEYRAANLTPEGFHQGFQKKKSEADLCASGAFNLAAGKGSLKLIKPSGIGSKALDPLIVKKIRLHLHGQAVIIQQTFSQTQCFG